MSVTSALAPEFQPEEWKPIEFTGNVYSISNLGRVRREKGGRGCRAGTILGGTVRPDGYAQVSLSVGNRSTRHLIHHLVADHFLGPRPKDRAITINHKNGDKTDNRAENLEYATYAENNAHAYKVLNRKPTRGARTSNLTDAKVIEMRQLASEGRSIGLLARQFGIARTYASKIIRGALWKHLNEVAPPTQAPTFDVQSRSVDNLPEWMPVPQVFGYEASKSGRVRRSAAGRGAQQWEEIKPQHDGTGYLQTRLSCGGEARTYKVHLLVAATFLGPKPPGYHCNHKNGKKHDNRIENLEYVTPRQNAEHALHTLKRKVARGEDRSKLTEDDVRAIRRRVAAGESRAAVALDFGISAEQAGRIVARTSWKHVE